LPLWEGGKKKEAEGGRPTYYTQVRLGSKGAKLPIEGGIKEGSWNAETKFLAHGGKKEPVKEAVRSNQDGKVGRQKEKLVPGGYGVKRRHSLRKSLKDTKRKVAGRQPLTGETDGIELQLPGLKNVRDIAESTPAESPGRTKNTRKL